jgi:hypothetical protein
MVCMNTDELNRRIQARRQDEDFKAKLRDAMDENREALALLRKGDEEQPEL